MKLSVPHYSNILLSNIDKLNGYVNDDYLIEINTLLKETPYNYLSDVYEKITSFKEEHDKYPSLEYLKELFPEYVDKIDFELSIDFLMDYRSELIKSINWLKLNEGYVTKDLVEIENALGHLKLINDRKINSVYMPSDCLDYYEKRKKLPAGMLLGASKMDHYLRGCTYGTLTVFAGRPGHGKTTLLVSSVYQSVVKDGFNALVFSLELPRSFLMNRLISRHSKELGTPIPYSLIEESSLTPEQEEIYKKVALNLEQTMKGSLYVYGPEDVPSFSNADVLHILTFVDGDIKDRYRRTDEYKQKIDGGMSDEDAVYSASLDVLWIDYIQLSELYVDGRTGSERTDQINQFIRFLVKTSTTFKNRMFALNILSQLNREAEEYLMKSGRLSKLTHLAEYNRLEREAHRVVILYNDSELKSTNQLKFQVMKHRTGVTMDDMEMITCDYGFYDMGSDDYAGMIDSSCLLNNNLGSQNGESITWE